MSCDMQYAQCALLVIWRYRRGFQLLKCSKMPSASIYRVFFNFKIFCSWFWKFNFVSISALCNLIKLSWHFNYYFTKPPKLANYCRRGHFPQDTKISCIIIHTNRGDPTPGSRNLLLLNYVTTMGGSQPPSALLACFKNLDCRQSVGSLCTETTSHQY